MEWLITAEGTILNARDGYIEFLDEDPNYISTVSEEVRAAQQKVVDAIMSGKLKLEVPEL